MRSSAVTPLEKQSTKYTKAHEEGLVLLGVSSWILYLSKQALLNGTTIYYNRAVSTPGAC